jgi:endonuclease-3 related protein
VISKRLYQYYQQLLQEYGDPINYWPQWCAKDKLIKEREKVIIGMILVQRTSWHNADIALQNLKKENLLSIEKIAKLKILDKLTRLIRPAGFYQSKPRRLLDICAFIVSSGGIKKMMIMDTANLRKELLNIKGIGQETADTILLYALDKPVFIIDEYTRRWVEKNNLTKEKDYAKLQQFFHSNLKPNLSIYRNFHTLIIVCQRGREKSKMEIV